MEKILIIRLSSIGDIILTFPLIDYLHQKYPNSQIDFLLKESMRDVLLPIEQKLSNVITLNKKKSSKNINSTRSIIKKEKYQLILDLQNNLTSYLLTIGLKAKIQRYQKERFKRWLFVKFRAPFYRGLPVFTKYLHTITDDHNLGKHFTINDWPEPSQRDLIRKKISMLTNLDLIHPYIMIFPGAKHGTKRWPKEYYSMVINQLSESYSLPILLSGSLEEKTLCAEIALSCNQNVFNLAGELSLKELYTLISGAELILSNDSAPAHMAALFGRKQVVIFGSTVKEFGFIPNNSKVKLIEHKNLSCRPCSHIGYERCPKGHFKCMTEISPEQVFSGISEMINHKKNRKLQ